MYTIRIEGHFDAAHFLMDYLGKCSNLHGHRWEVKVYISRDTLKTTEQERGMVEDFGTVKKALKELTDQFDHSLIYEKGSLDEKTLASLHEEEFHLVEVDFRPTAENFARYFYDHMKEKGFSVSRTTVFESPTSRAEYRE